MTIIIYYNQNSNIFITIIFILLQLQLQLQTYYYKLLTINNTYITRTILKHNYIFI